MALADAARAGNGQVVGIVAEAGMGKSRLVEETTRALSSHGQRAYSGAAAAVGSGSYLAWQGIWNGLLSVGADADPVPGLERALVSVDPLLLPRLPLLGAVLGTAIEDNDLTRSFEAKLRKSSLESMLLHYLARRAEREPLVIVLEDCHWLDALSADLVDEVARAAAALPVLVVVTYRPGSFSAPRLRHTTLLELDRLDEHSCEELLRARLAELYGPEMAPPERLLRRLIDRSGGNPFYLEELVSYLHAKGADLFDDRAAAAVELPTSLSTLVLSRIDTLAEPPRRTLKVASVVGREFSRRRARRAYPDLGTVRNVTTHLRRLCAYDLVVLDQPATDSYAFKHAVIREAAYESLPFSLRTVLHDRVGRWLEVTDPQALDLLAYHFWNSADDDKKRLYLMLAGDAAQAAYANDSAVDYFQRIIPLLADDARGSALLKLGAVLERRGDWTEAEAVFGQAVQLAGRLEDPQATARARAALADPVRKQGRFDDALAELEQAATSFEIANDAAGLGRVAHLRGTIAAQRGDYGEARSQYEQSLAIRVVLGDRPSEASLLSNLAIVAEYEEDYDRAEALNQQALDLRAELGDRWGLGISENNLGMIAYLRRDYHSARTRPRRRPSYRARGGRPVDGGYCPAQPWQCQPRARRPGSRPWPLCGRPENVRGGRGQVGSVPPVRGHQHAERDRRPPARPQAHRSRRGLARGDRLAPRVGSAGGPRQPAA